MSTHGYVLGPTEGEHLIRNTGSYIIKVDPSRGSNNIALGTQKVPIRTGILVHQHHEADEVLFVLGRHIRRHTHTSRKGFGNLCSQGRLAWSRESRQGTLAALGRGTTGTRKVFS